MLLKSMNQMQRKPSLNCTNLKTRGLLALYNSAFMGHRLVSCRSCSCRRCELCHQCGRFVFQLGAVEFSHAVQRHAVTEAISWAKSERQAAKVWAGWRWEIQTQNVVGKISVCPFLSLFARYILNP